MSSRVILVCDDPSALRSPETGLWDGAACLRGIHTDSWWAHIFEYPGHFEGNMVQVRELAEQGGVDIIHPHGTLAVQPPGLVVCDVDSTITRTEGIDLLAECAGRADEVSEVTARAMAGELDFAESLTQRVACLAGLPVDAVDEACRATVITPGAAELVSSAHRVGARVGLVSGGFTAMVEPVARQIGADLWAANELEVADGRLTGRLVGPVVDRAAKAARLQEWADELGVETCATVAVGDGANDLDMFAASGLPVAFCAKPVAVAAARNTISFERIDAVAAMWTW